MGQVTDALTLARQRESAVVGLSYVRIASPDLARQTAFYRQTFGLEQIGGILDHAVMLNVGASVEQARSNPAVRVILDSRMHPNAENPFVFTVRGIFGIMQRAVNNGARVAMEPLIARNGFIVAKFTDPAGNRIELLEEGTDRPEGLFLREDPASTHPSPGPAG
ncbi:VOC family protein [Paraburkholderia agricolaris]|uniref:VOC family protein n=1 Tax=Paraburkholderia agricolaris TaxID=2152888 RepID=A0ABW9A1I1_9BURK